MLFWQLVCLSTLELYSACLEFMTREVFQMNTGKNKDGSKFVLFPDCWHENFEKGKFSCLSPSLVLQLPGSSATPSLCEGTSINHHSRCLLCDFWGLSLLFSLLQPAQTALGLPRGLLLDDGPAGLQRWAGCVGANQYMGSVGVLCMPHSAMSKCVVSSRCDRC